MGPYVIHFLRSIADKGGYKALQAIKDELPYLPSMSHIIKVRNATPIREGLHPENLKLLKRRLVEVIKMSQDQRKAKGNRPLTEAENRVGAILFDEMKTKKGVRYSPLSGWILQLEEFMDGDSLKMKAEAFKKLDEEELDYCCL